MGCTTSKLDDLPAVALCSKRCQFLEEAIQQRYALADAHVAYIRSLADIGCSLDNFFNQGLDNLTSPPSPVLPLPTQRKGDPVSFKASSPAHVVGYHSHSNSDSHLHLPSDSDEDDDADVDSTSLHHSGDSSPLHHHHDHPDHDYETLGGPMNGGFMTMNYMKNRSTPSVLHEQRQMSPETVHMGDSSFYPYSYPNQEMSTAYPNYGYGNYGFFGSSPPYGSSSHAPPSHGAAPASDSSSKPPPPPPSPPRNSAWDFINLFDTVEKYYPQYTPSRDSKEVREEEGIPDLEDENYHHEVVKEVHGDQKFVDGGANYSKKVADDDARGNQSRPSVSVDNNGMEYEVQVDKDVVANEERSEERGNVAAFKVRGDSLGAFEVVREIKAQFERASESSNEISKMLEAGKIPYHRKNAVYQVSSKMLHSFTPSLSVVSSQPSTSKSAESSSTAEQGNSVYLDLEEDVGMRSGNLSSTLQKLHIWEKKLYDEVKLEEKMRIVHERKCRRMKRLDERGAEAHKVESTRTLIRNLSTKIRIAIQVVDKISIKISKLRDEELWPQINELISGFVRMWKVMLECHRNQCQAIAEAKSLDSLASNRKVSEAYVDAIVKLEVELRNWILNFSSWIGAQKGYVRALNGWLENCLLHEPEVTADGIAPFSPGRIGAPPVFVICNQWSQVMEKISENEVVGAMRAFAASVLQLRERHIVELRQKMMANREMDVKALERKEQKMQKFMQTIDKKMVLVSGQGISLSISGDILPQAANISNHLKQIFEAMERFTANSMQAYEELRVRSEEDRLARENAKVP